MKVLLVFLLAAVITVFTIGLLYFEGWLVFYICSHWIGLSIKTSKIIGVAFVLLTIIISRR